MTNSLVVRYADVVDVASRETLRQSSIRESARLLNAGNVDGVRIGLLDLSSDNTTGTFKDWLACVTIASCLEQGIQEFVAQSSGNTGTALVRYAAKFGIRVYLFYPATSRYKLNGNMGHMENATLIEVDGTEMDLKRLSAAFADLYGLPLLPTLKQQLETNKLRAYFLDDELSGEHFDWHVQAISSGYGIFGFYEGVEELDLNPPRLLGIQQEAVCPYAKDLARRNGCAQINPVRVIEPTLFRSQPPADLLERMRSICRRYDGRIEVIQNRQYDRYKEAAIQLLDSCGLKIQQRLEGERCIIREQAGLMAVAGCLRAIDEGVIGAGQSALVAITGGVYGAWTGRMTPTLCLPGCSDGETLLHLGMQFGLRPIRGGRHRCA